jgi:hypothetical protein
MPLLLISLTCPYFRQPAASQFAIRHLTDLDSAGDLGTVADEVLSRCRAIPGRTVFLITYEGSALPQTMELCHCGRSAYLNLHQLTRGGECPATIGFVHTVPVPPEGGRGRLLLVLFAPGE